MRDHIFERIAFRFESIHYFFLDVFKCGWLLRDEIQTLLNQDHYHKEVFLESCWIGEVFNQSANKSAVLFEISLSNVILKALILDHELVELLVLKVKVFDLGQFTSHS